MPLIDRQIRNLIAQGVIEYADNALVNPASLDLRIGEIIQVENPEAKSFNDPNRWTDVDISWCSPSNPVWLSPGQFALAHSLEIFNLPSNIVGQFLLKSSRAREGYQHALAGWCDPGWHGSYLTMELKNLSQYFPLPLYPGLRMGQIIFHEVVPPSACYATTGRYNGDLTAMPSKG